MRQNKIYNKAGSLEQDSNTSQTFVTRAGTAVCVRRIHADEAYQLVDLFNHLSSHSRFRRFHQSVDHINPSRIWREATRIAERDKLGDVCLVAFVKDVPIAAARYVLAEDEDNAELAISVRDDYQGQGVGKHLLWLLREEAVAAGIARLTAVVQNENEQIVHLLQALGWQSHRTYEGSASIITLFNPARP